MKITIVPSTNTVGVDHRFYDGLELASCAIPSAVHALQWNGTIGEIEYNSTISNDHVNELPVWATAAVTVWEQAEYLRQHPPAPASPTSEEIIASNKLQAEGLLKNSDWSVLSDVALANATAWVAYRSAVRAIRRAPTSNPNLEWPVKPAVIWVS